jgi:hypothetical protein
MFKTNSSGKRIVSRQRSAQIKKAEEVRASDCRYYASRCLPEAARLDAERMNCVTCRLKNDTGATLSTIDPDFLYEAATARRLLHAIFEGRIYDEETFETV